MGTVAGKILQGILIGVSGYEVGKQIVPSEKNNEVNLYSEQIFKNFHKELANEQNKEENNNTLVALYVLISLVAIALASHIFSKYLKRPRTATTNTV